MKKIIFSLVILAVLTGCTSNNRELLNAIRSKNVSKVEKILKSKNIELEPAEEPNMVNKPLAYAAAYGNLEIVKMIVEKGADLNGRVAYGDVPLIKAAENGNIDIIRYLLEKGADVNMPNSFGITPFIGFCLDKDKDMDIVKLAYEKGGEINKSYINYTQNYYGKFNYNALQFAVAKGRIEVIKFLIEKGGDPSIKTFDNKDCFDLAKENDEIKKILKREK